MRGIQSRYTYNHTGERSLKRYGAYESMAVNGAAAGSLLDPKSAYSAYVSPYYVEHGRGTESGAVTKHYYAGAERLASKVVTTTAKESEESSYYYFTDHLGSTTHITDRSGRTSQYAAYTPYGELFREYKKVLPYKFNGKELDQETGYYYYGARYYDPGAALWFGTDPLAHKYPMNSPYVYCNGNPIIYIDSDGEEGFSVTASVRITVGPQMGFDALDFVKAEVNIGSVDVINISGTLGIDEYGVYPKGNYNIIGIDGLNWEQDASIGAGIPVFGDVELSAKNIFAAKNDHVISDDKKSGVELDVDMFKMSFDLKCIIGVETEINVDVIEGNTFKYIFNQLVEFFNNQIGTNKDE